MLDLMAGYLRLYMILQCSIKCLGVAAPSEALSNPEIYVAQIRAQL